MTTPSSAGSRPGLRAVWSACHFRCGCAPFRSATGLHANPISDSSTRVVGNFLAETSQSSRRTLHSDQGRRTPSPRVSRRPWQGPQRPNHSRPRRRFVPISRITLCLAARATPRAPRSATVPLATFTWCANVHSLHWLTLGARKKVDSQWILWGDSFLRAAQRARTKAELTLPPLATAVSNTGIPSVLSVRVSSGYEAQSVCSRMANRSLVAPRAGLGVVLGPWSWPWP